MSLMPIGLTGLPVLLGRAPGVVSLLVNGMIYEGWTEVEIRRSVKQMAGEFLLHLSEKWAGGTNGPAALLTWQIRPGDACQVFYGGMLVITGYVDVYKPKYSKKSHTVTVQGRSKTGDLCDSSADAELKNGEANKVGIDALARRMCKNFGIGVKVEASDIKPPIPCARIQPGETVQETLERYARSRGVNLTDDEAGRLRLLQVDDGGADASLVEGVNIIEAGATLRADNRHSKVEAHGQNKGTDTRHGKKSAQVKASATDKAVKRYRPLRIISEGRAGEDDVKKRSAWESSARAGESVRVEARVADWLMPGGKVWLPGKRVQVTSPMLAVNRVLAIQNVVLKQSRNLGTITQLVLVPPEALNPKKGGAGKGDKASSASGGGGGGGGMRSGASDPMYSSTKPTGLPN